MGSKVPPSEGSRRVKAHVYPPSPTCCHFQLHGLPREHGAVLTHGQVSLPADAACGSVASPVIPVAPKMATFFMDSDMIRFGVPQPQLVPRRQSDKM